MSGARSSHAMVIAVLRHTSVALGLPLLAAGLMACGGPADRSQASLSGSPAAVPAAEAPSAGPASLLPSGAPANGCEDPLTATGQVPEPARVAAIRDCAVTTEGNLLVRTRREADSGLEPLLAALSAPAPSSTPLGVKQGCGASLVTPPDLQLLLADGSVIRPALLPSSCGPATPTMLQAYRDTDFTTVLERTVLGRLPSGPQPTPTS